MWFDSECEFYSSLWSGKTCPKTVCDNIFISYLPRTKSESLCYLIFFSPSKVPQGKGFSQIWNEIWSLWWSTNWGNFLLNNSPHNARLNEQVKLPFSRLEIKNERKFLFSFHGEKGSQNSSSKPNEAERIDYRKCCFPLLNQYQYSGGLEHLSPVISLSCRRRRVYLWCLVFRACRKFLW